MSQILNKDAATYPDEYQEMLYWKSESKRHLKAHRKAQKKHLAYYDKIQQLNYHALLNGEYSDSDE